MKNFWDRRTPSAMFLHTLDQNEERNKKGREKKVNSTSISLTNWHDLKSVPQMPPVEETGLTISLPNMVRTFSATSVKILLDYWPGENICTTKPRTELLTEGELTSNQRVTGNQNSFLIPSYATNCKKPLMDPTWTVGSVEYTWKL